MRNLLLYGGGDTQCQPLGVKSVSWCNINLDRSMDLGTIQDMVIFETLAVFEESIIFGKC